jgi:hypothetical protein
VLGVKGVWGGKSSKHKVEIQRKSEREREPVQQMKPKVHVMFDGRGKTYSEKE